MASEIETAICIECKKEFPCDTDITLCEKCLPLFNLDALWELHDRGSLDALDFNENAKMRETFRIREGGNTNPHT
jgi:hypothetical protein